MPRSTRLFPEVELCRVSPLSWGHLIPFPMPRILLGPLRRKKICPILFLSLLTFALVKFLLLQQECVAFNDLTSPHCVSSDSVWFAL